MSESHSQNFNHLKIHTQYSICEGAARIDDLQDNFLTQISENNTLMLVAFDALQTIVVNLKTDMLSNFNVAVDYTDADGD